MNIQSVYYIFIFLILFLFTGCKDTKPSSINEKYVWSVEKISKTEEQLLNQIKEKVSDNYANNPEKAKYYIRQSIEESRKTKSHYSEFNALAYMSQYFWLREGNTDSAIYYFGEALKLMAKNNIVEIENEFIYVDMGNMFYSSGMFYNAIHSYRMAQNTAIKKNSDYSIVLANNNIGLCFIELNETDSVMYYFNRAHQIGKKMMPFYEINAYLLMSAAHDLSENINESERYLRLAQDAYNRQKAWKKPLIQIDQNYYNYIMERFEMKFYFARADIYSARNQTQAAIEMLNKASQLAVKQKNIEMQTFAGISLAEEYLKTGDYQNAREKALNSLYHTSNTRNFEFRMDCARILTDIYAHEKNLDEVLKYVKIADAAEDSIISDEEMHKNQQSRLLMLSNQINRDVLLFEYEYKDSLKDIQKQKLVIALMTFLILSIIVLLIIIYRDKKDLNKEYKLLMEKMLLQIKNENKNGDPKIKKAINILPGFDKKLEVLMNTEKIFLNSNISLSELSTLLGTNTSYLSQYLNDNLNTNFNDYINAERVNEACRIMAKEVNSNKSLDQIAEEVGFNSRSTFYSAFKKFTGITPAYFMKNIESMKLSKNLSDQ